jgi:hypothetical protein
MAPSKDKVDSSSTPQRRTSNNNNLTHRRHHSIANDTINDIVGGMNLSLPSVPSSAPRMGGRNRHNRHATHSHIDLENDFPMDDEFAMARYLDDVESSDQVQDICSFQDVNLDTVEKGGGNTSSSTSTSATPGGGRHHRHTSSDISFHSHLEGTNATPRRARRMYYLMPLMYKHRYPIVACMTIFLVCVIAISASVKSSMDDVVNNSLGSGVAGGGGGGGGKNGSWKDNVDEMVVDLPPLPNEVSGGSGGGEEEEMEMVGPPLEISSDQQEEIMGSGSGHNSGSTIHQPQQLPTDGEDGAFVIGPGEAAFAEEESTSSRTPCMTSTECEARSDLLGFPTYDEGPFVHKGCYYEGSVVYWGTGTTTTNDDEEDNDVTAEELTGSLRDDDDKNRLYCDEDEEIVAIDKVAAEFSIAKGEIDAEEEEEEGGIIANETDIVFENIDQILQEEEDQDGAFIVGENFGMEEDNTTEEGGGDDEDGVMIVGAPLQVESNPEDFINGEWYATDTAQYISLIVEGMGPHETAMKFCENKSKSLCNYNDYCPEGKSTRVYQGGPEGTWVENSAESEQWAPVMIHSSESAAHKWVQIGKVVDGGDASENYGQCWTYQDWMNRDDADMTEVEDTIEESHRRFFLCCDN